MREGITYKIGTIECINPTNHGHSWDGVEARIDKEDHGIANYEQYKEQLDKMAGLSNYIPQPAIFRMTEGVHRVHFVPIENITEKSS